MNNIYRLTLQSAWQQVQYSVENCGCSYRLICPLLETVNVDCLTQFCNDRLRLISNLVLDFPPL